MKTEKEIYEEDLRRRQEEHLRNVSMNGIYNNWKPCLHDQCTECHGTGIKLDGSMCIHNIACTCPKCSIYC